MVEHYLLMKAADGAAAELETALQAFVADIVTVDSVSEASAGPNFNVGARQRGWTHGMLVRLRAPGDLAGYWDHPHHQRLLGILDRTTEERFAMDHEVESGV